MYERFTDRARKVMQLANQEAQRFGHEYIGTEHLLLGLCKEGGGVAANVLKNLHIDLRTIRLAIERVVQPGTTEPLPGRLPHSPGAKAVVEFAIEEAKNLNHNYVGTEHLLLGLTRVPETIGGKVLTQLEAKPETVRAGVLELLEDKPAEGVPLREATNLGGWHTFAALSGVQESGKIFALPAGVTYRPAPRPFAVTIQIDGSAITLEADSIPNLIELRRAWEAGTADKPVVRGAP